MSASCGAQAGTNTEGLAFYSTSTFKQGSFTEPCGKTSMLTHITLFRYLCRPIDMKNRAVGAHFLSSGNDDDDNNNNNKVHSSQSREDQKVRLSQAPRHGSQQIRCLKRAKKSHVLVDQPSAVSCHSPLHRCDNIVIEPSVCLLKLDSTLQMSMTV